MISSGSAGVYYQDEYTNLETDKSTHRKDQNRMPRLNTQGRESSQIELG